MSDLVLEHYENGLVVLSLNAPPFNMLGPALREAIIASVQAAEANPDVKGIVLWAQGRMFSSGSDIEEYTKEITKNSLSDVCTTIENCSKPVVAALHGAALGGGLELAMAAHARIATPECMLRMPEIKLGLLPGAGGTQRLPRLCGAGGALNMMLGGVGIKAREGLTSGLIDRLSENDLWVEAQDLVWHALRSGELRRTRDKVAGADDPTTYQSEVEAAREAASGPLVKLRHSICQLVEAAQILPFDVGVKMEAAAFETVRTSRTFLALKHVFFAEKSLANGFARTSEPASVGILGNGPQVVMVAREALLSKMTVHAYGMDQNTQAAILKSLHVYSRRRHLSQSVCDGLVANLKTIDRIEDLHKADLMIDASRVNGKELAQRYMATEGEAEKPLLVLNTARDIPRLEGLTGRRGSIMTLLTPPQRVFELLSPTEINTDALRLVQAFTKRLGRLGIVAKAPLRKPLQQAHLRSAIWALKHGANPRDVDEALLQFGYRIGPFHQLDLDGIDMVQARLNRQAGDPFWIELVDRLCATGALGVKTGTGFYNHVGGKTDSDILIQTLKELRKKHVIEPRNLSRGEIQLRDVTALVSAGCQSLEQGVVSKPALIDLMAVASLDFPRWRGGPLRSAQSHGLLAVQKAIRKFSQDDHNLWHDSTVMANAVKTADGFDAL